MRKAIFGTLVLFFLSISVLSLADTTENSTPQVTDSNSITQKQEAVKPKKKLKKIKKKKAKKVKKLKTTKVQKHKTKKPKIKKDPTKVQD